MDLLRIHQGPQPSIFVAGYLFVCLLPLVVAQQRLTVIPEPPNPKWGHHVLLNLQGAPNQIEQCSWKEPSGETLEIGGTPVQKPGPFDSLREMAVAENCSLQIWNLTPFDQGNYSVRITTAPSKKQDGLATNYEGYILLKIFDDDDLTVKVEPQNPVSGEEVTLIPEGLPKSFSRCEWSRITYPRREEKINVSTSEKHTNQKKKRMNVKQDCSLHITQLTGDDSGKYTVFVDVPSKHSKEPGKGNEALNELYLGQVFLPVTEYFLVTVQSNISYHSGSTTPCYKAAPMLYVLPLFFCTLLFTAS